MGFAEQIARVDRNTRRLLGGVAVIYQPMAAGHGSFSGAFSHAFGAAPIPAPVTVLGIFDTPYVLSQGDQQAGVGVAHPTVFLRKDELPTDPEVDEPLLTIGGVVYRVVERDPDGFNGIVLGLRTNG